MQLVGFILIVAIWAAFLLPSFFDSRRKAPMATTRSFARDTALLATVASSTVQEVAARRRASARRQRTLILLSGGAAATLAVAIWQSNVAWLGVSLGFDVALAGFVTMLLYVRRQRIVTDVTPIATPVPLAAASGKDPQRHTVRVVAG